MIESLQIFNFDILNIASSTDRRTAVALPIEHHALHALTVIARNDRIFPANADTPSDLPEGDGLRQPRMISPLSSVPV